MTMKACLEQNWETVHKKDGKKWLGVVCVRARLHLGVLSVHVRVKMRF